MSQPNQANQLLIDQIRQGDESAWQQLIDRYEGRLTAFIRARLRDTHVVEDVLQETLLGFLRSLPHYDPTRDLENYLFTIAAHKIRDFLRKDNRHPTGITADLEHDENIVEPMDRIRGASSLLASAERLAGEEARLSASLRHLIDEWIKDGDYRRVKCMELLFVIGWPNREVAQHLGLTEQQVANYKFQVVERLSRKHRADFKE